MRPLVLVPTYNERDNLRPLIAALMAIDGLQVLIVDDNSPDGTADEAESIGAASHGRVSVMRRPGARGLGRSYIDGIAAALRTDATHVCQMDADFSHDPAGAATTPHGRRRGRSRHWIPVYSWRKAQ
jgi:dolichol-phosphate mannosyltransferase